MKCLEELQVLDWRLAFALRLGYSVPTAELIAADQPLDLHRLAELIENGCPPITAWRILAT